MGATEKVLLTHGDSIVRVSPEFDVIASSGDIPAAIANEDKKLYGVQFHPEVDLTENGQKIFQNFINLSGFGCTFTESYRDEVCIKQIKDQVGSNGKILVLVSGGVDSCVLAALCFKAIGQERVKEGSLKFHLFPIETGSCRKIGWSLIRIANPMFTVKNDIIFSLRVTCGFIGIKPEVIQQ